MRLYIKGDYSKKIQLGYRELAGKMWFQDSKEKKLEISNVGNNDMLQEDFFVMLQLRKDEVDKRWSALKLPMFSLDEESISLQFEDAYVTNYQQKGEHLRIASFHLNLLTVDKRAMFIMAIEVASRIDGKISEDNKQTWITVDEFKKKHEDILSLTYEEANEISLKEINIMEAVDEPFWDEEKQRVVNLFAERYHLASDAKQRLLEALKEGYNYEETEEIAKKLSK